MRFWRAVIIGLAPALTMLVSGRALGAHIVIDDFEGGAVNLSVGGGYGTPVYDALTEYGLPAGTLGGSRTTHVARGWGFQDYSQAELVAGRMVFRMDNDSQAGLTYANLGGVDLTAGGSVDSLALDVIEQTMHMMFVYLHLVDTYGVEAQLLCTLGSVFPPSQSSGVMHFEFADLTGGAISLTEIDSIALTFAGIDDGRIIIDNIVAGVPEPAALVGLLLGLVALRRR